MEVTIDIPDSLANELFSESSEPSRAVLESLAVDAYHTGKLGESEVSELLGYGTRIRVHELLKAHDIYLKYSMEDLREDIDFARERVAAKAAHPVAA